MKWFLSFAALLALAPQSARSQTCPPPESTQSVDNNNGTYSVSQIVEVNPIIWISNAGEDTISKFNTAQNKEVARYRVAFWAGGIGGNGTSWGTHDAWTGPAPSRSGVDASGNAFIANRGFNRVAEVIKVLSTGCIDRNNNGVCDTSQDTNGDGAIQQNEMYGVVDSNANGVIEDTELRDERVAFIRPVGTSNEVARALTIDKSGFVWVGMFNTQRIYKVDPNTGATLGNWALGASPYGAVVDSQNRLFTAGLDTNVQKRLDTNNPASQTSYTPESSYSLAIGRINGAERIVFAHRGGRAFSIMDPSTLSISLPISSGYPSNGVNIDRNGDIVVGALGVTKFRYNAQGQLSVVWQRGLHANCPVANSDRDALRGTIPDANNDIWLVNLYQNRICKYLENGDFSVILPTGLSPYTYTDASGIGTLVTNPTGRVVWQISAFEGNYDWSGEEVCFPGSGDVTVTIAAANSPATLEFANPVNIPLNTTGVMKCGNIPNGVIGQYVRFVFTIKTGASITTTNIDGSCAINLPEPNTRPVALCKNVNITADWCTAILPYVNNGSYDPDGPGDVASINQVPAPGGTIGPGQHPATLTITDHEGFAASCVGTTTVTPTPRAEVCDGVDNDCDGSTDEGFVAQPTTCGVGACARTGQTTCVGGVLGNTCTAGTPSAEVCDGIDNDCDGLTDGVDPNLVLPNCERQAGVCGGAKKAAAQCVGGAWQQCPGSVYASHAFPHYSTSDACDGRDNDCDGAMDEDFANENTTCGQGVCARAGVRQCNAGVVVDTCVAGQANGNDTDCNGLDNDCDGQADEGWVVTQTSCGSGACTRSGQAFCIGGRIFDTCTASNPGGSDTLCNGIDDDCDGAIDEDFQGGQICVVGTGACQRTGALLCGEMAPVCSVTAGVASPEVCDGVDNDCDGSIDEGVGGSVCSQLDTAITSAPPAVTASRAASFQFNDPLNTEADAFECSLDGGAWVRCDGGAVSYQNLADGSHTFLVRAVGPDGSVDATPAFHGWRIDQSQPDTLIVIAPSNPSQSTTASFAFGATVNEIQGYRCALDPANVPPAPAAFVDCGATMTYPNLSEGSHTLFVYVISAAGVADPTPARHTWVIDLSAPETEITSGPASVTSETSASLSYRSPGEPTLTTFRCRIDGGAWTACNGGSRSYEDLTDGEHVFEVAAVDAGGIVDPTPATWRWVVDTQPPDTFITVKPDDPSQQEDATFAFASDELVVTYRCAFDVPYAPETGAPEWVACDAVMVWENLSSGEHTIWVAAVDEVGHWDPSPATWSWTVDLSVPDTIITSQPNVQTGPNDGATFTYDSPGDGENYFECRVDGGAWVRCDQGTLTIAPADLAVGDHTFMVRACTVASGLCDPTPAIASWAVTTSNCPLDATPPTLTCPVGGTHECTGNGQAAVALGALQASDACGVIEVSELVPTAFGLGTTPVVLSVQDGNRNRASCVAEVTVVDTQAPTILCGSNIVVDNDQGVCGAVVELQAPVVEDACHTTVTVLNNAPPVFPVGDTVVTWTALDPTGLSASCEITVTVRDAEAGNLECAGEMTIDAAADQCGWAGTIEALARDNCAVDIATLTQEREYMVGVTDVLFTALDPHENESTCTTRLTVRDVTAPAVSCPAETGEPGTFVGTASDACTATVTLGTLRCEGLGADGSVTEVVGEDCPAMIDANGALVVSGRLAGPALRLRFEVIGTDPSGNVGRSGCELNFSADGDGDEVIDADDNCDGVSNPDQRDTDGDGIGDLCDVCPQVDDDQRDSDGNGVGDACQDTDRDEVLDQFDNCPGIENADQGDSDGDGIGDPCDPEPWEGLSAAGSGSAGCAGGGMPGLWLGLVVLGLVVRRRRT